MQLAISNLTKVYRHGVRAIDNLNLEAGAGMLGLLGPNGAGKSTLMRIIATLQRPDAGGISFNGIDVLQEPMRLRRVLGYLPQEFGVYPKVSAENLLDYFATLKGVASRADRRRLIGELLEITNLYEVRKKHVDSYSGGMKQRFGIAQLLLNNPQLIIVDEPTAGLDPAERRRFLNILREVAWQSAVIFSTHIVDDVRELCNEMAIMNGGRLLRHTTPAAATAALHGQVWSTAVPRQELKHMEAQYNVLSSNYNQQHSIDIRVYAPQRPSPAFSPAEPLLEDAYFLALKEDAPSPNP